MSIKIGPAGMGPVKDAEETFEEFRRLGIKASEIPFTYGIFITKKEIARKVGKAAEKFGIQLSIHAPYWINLNSAEKEKIAGSKQRILKCCEIGTYLGAKRVVFHPGYYGKKSKEETYENIKKEILELQKEIKKKKYTPKLAPETTGKINVFGGISEIKKLVEETGCSFCIDFAHILARYKTYNFKRIKKEFKEFKKWHVHFSGIDYGEKGEKKHLQVSEKEFRRLLLNLPKNKEITIINESPSPLNASLTGLKALNKLRR
ncbi:MAG: TIM barrel protein [Nanoarchaeota archaeon]|nr:TIM barrel protein [Nanoarchaeota archaeon]